MSDQYILDSAERLKTTFLEMCGALDQQGDIRPGWSFQLAAIESKQGEVLSGGEAHASSAHRLSVDEAQVGVKLPVDAVDRMMNAIPGAPLLGFEARAAHEDGRAVTIKKFGLMNANQLSRLGNALSDLAAHAQWVVERNAQELRKRVLSDERIPLHHPYPFKLGPRRAKAYPVRSDPYNKRVSYLQIGGGEPVSLQETSFAHFLAVVRQATTDAITHQEGVVAFCAQHESTDATALAHARQRLEELRALQGGAPLPLCRLDDLVQARMFVTFRKAPDDLKDARSPDLYIDRLPGLECSSWRELPSGRTFYEVQALASKVLDLAESPFFELHAVTVGLPEDLHEYLSFPLQKVLEQFPGIDAFNDGIDNDRELYGEGPMITPEPSDADKIKAVDDAYTFSAADEFKLWLHESLGKEDYSPFFSAREMDKAAKENGARIVWGDSFGNTPYEGSENLLAGVLMRADARDGHSAAPVLARVEICDDGKSMVWLGTEGDRRPVTQRGATYRFSDEDAADMVRDTLRILAEEALPRPAPPLFDLSADRAGVFDAAPLDVPDGWIVMNASRPLLGTRTEQNNDPWPGRAFYAAIDPSDSMAQRYLDENRCLNAYVVLVATEDEQTEMVISTSGYRDAYMEMEPEERRRATQSLRHKLNEQPYGELVERLGAVRAAPKPTRASEPTWFGTVRARAEDEAFLAGLGIKLGKHDERRGEFLAAASDEAWAALQQFAADHPAKMFECPERLDGGDNLSAICDAALKAQLARAKFEAASGQRWRTSFAEAIEEEIMDREDAASVAEQVDAVLSPSPAPHG